jgi:hypothetical protein
VELIATQNNLMQVVLQPLHNKQPNQQPHQQQAPPPPPSHQSWLAEFLRTRHTSFSQSKEPMEAEDWLKGIEKKLVTAQWTDHEKMLFPTHQLFGTATNWWATYYNTHADVDSITWNEFQTHFCTHYVPRSTMKLKNKVFTDLKQGSMFVNAYLNSFIQLSRYASEDINMDEKKQDMFLNGLNNYVQFQLLNTDYANFQRMVDIAIWLKTKLRKWRKMASKSLHFMAVLRKQCLASLLTA